jgi:hypothetical protein
MSRSFKYHKLGHRIFECPTFKRKTTSLEVEKEYDDGSKSELSKEEVSSILVEVLNTEVE